MVENLMIIKKCNLCLLEASSICFKCKKYFCDNCYKIIHEIKKNNEHEKTKINPYLSIDFFCQNHPEYPLELFCLNDGGKDIIYIINSYF